MADNMIKYLPPVKSIRYSLILATDERGGIGLNNDLPWKGIVDNKSDMKWFRDRTKGKIVIMGYNTWVSMNKTFLRDRYNIIISKNNYDEVNAAVEAHKLMADIDGKGSHCFKVFKSPFEAIEAINHGRGEWHSGGEVMVMGGAKIYESFMEHTSMIYLTTFDGKFEADTFVNLDLKDWYLRYRDNLSLLEPKFEIWECTPEAANRPDSEILQISYGHKPEPEELVPPHRKNKENGKNV
jgi:dihydrofolate reductase